MNQEYQARWYDKAVPAALIISYVCFVIVTFFQQDFLIHIFSPLTATLAATLIMLCLTRMGGFWVPSFILGLGIYFWVMGDILTLYNLYGRSVPLAAVQNLTDAVYLLPNFCSAASVAVYFIQKLTGRSLYQFLTNTLTFTIIGFVVLRKFLTLANTYEELDTYSVVQIYISFFVCLFIIIMVVHMTYMIASETGLKATNTMILGILVYALLEIQYFFRLALGQDPDSTYINLIYMLCMMLMAHGIFHQIRFKHAFRLKEYVFDERTMRRTRVFVTVGIIVGLILLFTGFLPQTDFFYLLIALLVCLIMTSTFQNGALNEQLIKQQDLLTGLYNRRYFATVFEASKKKADESGNGFGIYAIDLNHFKPVNDTYGHDMGDRVLKEFGARMLSLPEDYISFRTGGDEFMVIRNRVSKEEELMEGGCVLQELFHTPLQLDSYTFQLSGSIGTSYYPVDGDRAEDLIRFADEAMYVVKHSGNKDDVRRFDSGLIETVRRHRHLEELIRKADISKDFVLFFQPQMDLDTGELLGVEVFPRLAGEEAENYSAGDIIPVAEETGLMGRLGNWVVKEALTQVQKWNSKKNRKLSVTINLAALQLLDEEFLSYLRKTVEKMRISPEKVNLDVTNKVIMGAADSAKATLRSLRKYGFSLSLNDFGGGDINLSHILDCGFSAIDMSHSLIVRAEEEPEANVLLRSIIAIAETMGISAAAVGIETESQARMAKELKIRQVQGFFYGKPQSAESFEMQFL